MCICQPGAPRRATRRQATVCRTTRCRAATTSQPPLPGAALHRIPRQRLPIHRPVPPSRTCIEAHQSHRLLQIVRQPLVHPPALHARLHGPVEHLRRQPGGSFHIEAVHRQADALTHARRLQIQLAILQPGRDMCHGRMTALRDEPAPLIHQHPLPVMRQPRFLQRSRRHTDAPAGLDGIDDDVHDGAAHGWPCLLCVCPVRPNTCATAPPAPPAQPHHLRGRPVIPRSRSCPETRRPGARLPLHTALLRQTRSPRSCPRIPVGHVVPLWHSAGGFQSHPRRLPLTAAASGSAPPRPESAPAPPIPVPSPALPPLRRSAPPPRAQYR